MPQRQQDPRATLSRNLRALMDKREWDQNDVAKAAGVSQKTVSNMLRMEGSPRVQSVSAVAEAFGLQGWQLLATDLADGVPDLLTAYLLSSSEGQEMIRRVAEREAEYSKQAS